MPTMVNTVLLALLFTLGGYNAWRDLHITKLEALAIEQAEQIENFKKRLRACTFKTAATYCTNNDNGGPACLPFK